MDVDGEDKNIQPVGELGSVVYIIQYIPQRLMCYSNNSDSLR